MTLLAVSIAIGGCGDDDDRGPPASDDAELISQVPVPASATEIARADEPSGIVVTYRSEQDYRVLAQEFQEALSEEPWQVTTYDDDDASKIVTLIFRAEELDLLGSARVESSDDGAEMRLVIGRRNTSASPSASSATPVTSATES